MPYQVELKPRAEKALSQLPARTAERVAEALRVLEESPFPRGALKLGGTTAPLWRLRVGEYRIIYSVYQRELRVIVQQIARRTGQTYERL